MAQHTKLAFREQSMSINWGSMMFSPEMIGDLNTTLAQAYDNTVLLKTTPFSQNTYGDVVIKLPGQQSVVRLNLNHNWARSDGQMGSRIYAGTGYNAAQNQVLNETVLLPNWGDQWVNQTTLWTRMSAVFSPTGFLVHQTVEEPWNTSYFGTHLLGACVVMKEDGSGIDPDKLLVFAGHWGCNNWEALWRGELVKVGLYSFSQATFVNQTVTTLPFMYMANFSRGVDPSDAKLYGIKAYSPLPPYQEVPMFRVFASDYFGRGVVAETGDRNYLTADENGVPLWNRVMRSWGSAFPTSAGRLGIHWEP